MLCTSGSTAVCTYMSSFCPDIIKNPTCSHECDTHKYSSLSVDVQDCNRKASEIIIIWVQSVANSLMHAFLTESSV